MAGGTWVTVASGSRAAGGSAVGAGVEVAGTGAVGSAVCVGVDAMAPAFNGLPCWPNSTGGDHMSIRWKKFTQYELNNLRSAICVL